MASCWRHLRAVGGAVCLRSPLNCSGGHHGDCLALCLLQERWKEVQGYTPSELWFCFGHCGTSVHIHTHVRARAHTHTCTSSLVQVGFTQYNPTSGAVALGPTARDSSGMVLLKHRTTTDDFLPSVDGQQGGNIPWGMQRNMRHSLMESLPAVDLYATDHKGNHLSQEQDISHRLMVDSNDPHPSRISPSSYASTDGNEGITHGTSNISSIADSEAGEDLRASAPRVDLSAPVAKATSSSSISSSSLLISTYGR